MWTVSQLMDTTLTRLLFLSVSPDSVSVCLSDWFVWLSVHLSFPLLIGWSVCLSLCACFTTTFRQSHKLRADNAYQTVECVWMWFLSHMCWPHAPCVGKSASWECCSWCYNLQAASNQSAKGREPGKSISCVCMCLCDDLVVSLSFVLEFLQVPYCKLRLQISTLTTMHVTADLETSKWPVVSMVNWGFFKIHTDSR